MAIGTPEIVIIFVVILLIFGPKKIPELFRSVRTAVQDYRSGVSGKKRSKE